MASEEILERIRKCLRLAAEGSGATEPERATALRMAEGLIKEHKVSRKQLFEKGEYVSKEEWIVTVTQSEGNFDAVFRKHAARASRTFKVGGECFACGHKHIPRRCKSCGCEEIV